MALKETDLKCPQCGTAILENAKFCDKCGNKITTLPKITPKPMKTENNNDKENEVRIAGVKFNIPEGYEEDIPLREVNKYNSSLKSLSNAQVFKDKNNNIFSIIVTSIKNLDYDEKLLEKGVSDQNLDKKSINGIDGYFGREPEQGSALNKFTYVQLKRLVVITANDSEIFKDVVVKNDESDYDKLPPVEYKSQPNVAKLIYGIIGLFVTLLIMNGALSGTRVLRGTNSSEALFYVCILFLIWDIYYIYKAYKG